MNSFLGLDFWQGIGAIVGIMGILITIYFFRLEQHKREFAYKILTFGIISVESEFAQKIQIYYENQLVTDVSLVTIKLINSGREPIKPADFHKPVSINFGDTERVLDAEVFETFPKSAKIDASILLKESKIILEPTLFNPGDTIVIRALVSDLSQQAVVDGRIVGIRRIVDKGEVHVPYWFSILLILFGLFNLFISTIMQDGSWIFGAAGPLFMILGTLMLYVTWKARTLEAS